MKSPRHVFCVSVYLFPDLSMASFLLQGVFFFLALTGTPVKLGNALEEMGP